MVQNTDLLLIQELCKLPTETSWVEFKHDNYRPEMIGKDICALSNSSLLAERNSAYMIWGIADDTHEIVGTSFNLQSLKKEMRNWRVGCATSFPTISHLNSVNS